MQICMPFNQHSLSDEKNNLAYSIFKRLLLQSWWRVSQTSSACAPQISMLPKNRFISWWWTLLLCNELYLIVVLYYALSGDNVNKIIITSTQSSQVASTLPRLMTAKVNKKNAHRTQKTLRMRIHPLNNTLIIMMLEHVFNERPVHKILFCNDNIHKVQPRR